MPPDQPPIPLALGVFLLLRDLIEATLGVHYNEDKKDVLGSKLEPRLRDLGLGSFLDYFYLLKYDPAAAREWPALTDALSVQETYFWRESDHLRALTDVLVPEHVAARRGPIRIWSAACATGEEPLSLAMALARAGWFERAEVTIQASDASPAALDRAAAGVYRERSFRALPLPLRDAHFTATADGWRVSGALRQRVSYTRANLLDPPAVAPLASARFVFCRNVFIYFSRATVARVVAQFAECMPSPGFLFVGTTESLLRMHPAFELEESNGAFFYAKR